MSALPEIARLARRVNQSLITNHASELRERSDR